jgi:ribosomal protein S20
VLNLAAAAGLLRANHSDAALAEAQDRLWTIALALDGALPDAAEQALAQAREDMRRALDDRQHGKITDTEMARKIEALRRALAQRLAEIARHALQKGQLRPVDPQAQKYSSPVLDHMMKQMEQALREGRMEDAKRQLAELDKMLDKLKNAKVLSPEEARQAAQAKRQGKQMMGAAQDLVQREGQLMDHVQARAPLTPKMPPRFPMWGQDAAPPPDPDQLEANRNGQLNDRKTEGAMARALDALKQGFAASGGKVPQNLDDAGKDMQNAQQALQDGNDTLARAAEGKAVTDLQKGGQDMAKQMQKNTELAIAPGGQGEKDDELGEGNDGTGDEPSDGQSADGKRDPLGRQLTGTGGRATDDGSVHVPTDIEAGRSRAIQEELRRRGADRERPQHELDYIDRLLKPFGQ